MLGTHFLAPSGMKKSEYHVFYLVSATTGCVQVKNLTIYTEVLKFKLLKPVIKQFVLSSSVDWDTMFASEATRE